MQICQLDIDSLTVNMISCSIFNDPTLSLIARMIEKYACFKCWYLKYQSLNRKYMCFHIFLFRYLWRNYRCFINGNNMNLPCPWTFYVLQKSYHCTWIICFMEIIWRCSSYKGNNLKGFLYIGNNLNLRFLYKGIIYINLTRRSNQCRFSYFNQCCHYNLYLCVSLCFPMLLTKQKMSRELF